MAIDGNRIGMNVALTSYWERFIKRVIKSGRFNNASEVVRAGLRRLEHTESSGECYPPGSLRHLYPREENAHEARRARSVRIPKPEEA